MIVFSQGSDEVHIISADGKKNKTFLSSKDGTKELCYVTLIDGTLTLWYHNNTKSFVYEH